MSAGSEGAHAPRALTDEQQAAVERRSEPLLLSAAAGSGKTSVLVERFVAAVRDDEISTARILALTFTERAAGELRERIRAALLALDRRDAAREAEAASVGTFHGFCARVLRAHPLAAGLPPDFAILDEGVAAGLRDDAFAEALRGFFTDVRPDAVDLAAAYGNDELKTMVGSAYARLRSQGMERPRLPAGDAGEPRQPASGEPRGDDDGDGDDVGDAASVEVEDREARAALVLLGELLGRYADAYEQLKRERGAVDFDDLELRTRALLQGDEGVRREWSESFELLMVDEFQDTNPRQLGILRALARENLFTVGDALQSIYGFRHADVSLFGERREQLARSGGALELTRNFRSVPAVLAVVNSVFADRFESFSPLRGVRDTGPPAADGSPPVELLLTARAGWEQDEELSRAVAEGLPASQLWRQAEARLLAQRVSELVAEGTDPGEIAVLTRATTDLQVFERALQLRGLRTLAAVGGFWGHQQTQDLIAYLRALANPLDEEALYGVIASPLVGLPPDTLALLGHAVGQARDGGLWATLERASDQPVLAELDPADRERLLRLRSDMDAERREAGAHTVSELIERVVARSGYREHVLRREWGERRLANIHKLLRVARTYEAGEGRDLRGFLDHVERMQVGATREADAPVEGVEPDTVRLMSIHAAKGLEFPVVCVADLGRQPYTQQPKLLVDGERVGLRLKRLDGESGTPTLRFGELEQEAKAAEAAEEDRILYVAMTRARDRLLLSGAVDFEQWKPWQAGAPAIRWVGPAVSEEIPELAAAGVAETQLDVGGTPVTVRFSSRATVDTVLRREALARQTPPARPFFRSGAPAPTASPADQLALLANSEHTRTAHTTFSYTSLSELERCGYRYYVERVLHIGEERAGRRGGGEGLEARARGTLVHALLEHVDFKRPLAPGAAELEALAALQGVTPSASERDQILELVAGALRAPLAARLAAATDVRAEHPFAFALGSRDPMVVGVLDVLAGEPEGSALVVDYKSDRVTPADDLEAVTARDYEIQRLLYALAVLRGGPGEVEVVHWFLARPLEPVAVRFTAAEAPELLRRLRARVEVAREGKFEVSPNPHDALCRGCPARGGLCSWPREATEGDAGGAPSEDPGPPLEVPGEDEQR